MTTTELAGKKFSVFGDSISTLEGFTPQSWRNFYEGAEADISGVHSYADTWWGQVIDHFNGELLSNAAYSGSLVEGDGFPSATAPERIAVLAGGVGAISPEQIAALEVAKSNRDGRPISNPVHVEASASRAQITPETNNVHQSDLATLHSTDISPQAPDVILVFIGINDYGWGSAAAGVLGASPAAPIVSARLLGNDVYGHVWTSAELPTAEESQVARAAFERDAADAPQTRLARFAQAYDLMLNYMRTAYPQAEIWCCTLVPGRLQGAQTSTHTYNLRGIPFADYNDAIRMAATKNGAHVADIFAADQDYEAFDGTHPTALGMRQLSALIIAAMEGKPFPEDSGWQATDPCVMSMSAYAAPQDASSGVNPMSACSAFTCVASSVADAPPNCATCPYANINTQRWSCVCGASVKPL